MAHNIKLKRSAVAGKVPAVSALNLGELAVNTTDGKVYQLQVNGATSGVIQVGQNPDTLKFNTNYSTSTPSAGQVWWNSQYGTLNIQTEVSATTIQVGQETLIKVYNNLGYDIPDGSAVYINGSFNAFPTVALAIANNTDTGAAIGVATNKIIASTYGYVTVNGVVHDLNTASFSPGDKLYVSYITPGAFTNTSPPVTGDYFANRLGYVLTSHATTGSIFVRTAQTVATNQDLGLSNSQPPTQHAVKHYADTKVSLAAISDAKLMTGWVDNNAISGLYTYASTGGYLTFSHPQGVRYMWRGVEVNLGTSYQFPAHPGVTGRYFLYMTEPGTAFAWSTNEWQFTDLMVAVINFNATDSSRTWGIREHHGMMDAPTHEEFHKNIGTWKESGCTASAGSYTLNSGNDSATRPWFTAGVLVDEDLKTSLPAITGNAYTTYYVNDSISGTFTPDWPFPFMVAASGTPNTNILVNNTASGTLVDTTTFDQFVNVYQILFPVGPSPNSQRYRAIYLQPQRTYSSSGAAAGEAISSLEFGGLFNFSEEFYINARLMYATGHNINTYLNTGKVALVDISYILGTRANQTSVAGITPSNHASLSNLEWLASGHTGTANTIAGFDNSGLPKSFTLGNYGSDIFAPPATGTNGYVLTVSGGQWIAAAASAASSLTAAQLGSLVNSTNSKTITTIADADKFDITDSTAGASAANITWAELKKHTHSASAITSGTSTGAIYFNSALTANSLNVNNLTTTNSLYSIASTATNLFSSNLTASNLTYASSIFNSALPAFGQPISNTNELCDVLWLSDRRFTVTTTSMPSPANLFDGDFNTAVTLPTSSTSIININMSNQSGIPVSGITYPAGYVYVSFYFTSINYNTIQLRTKGSGVWNTAAAPTDISITPGYKLLRFTIPSGNYLSDIELTIDVGAGPCLITAINYIVNRYNSITEVPYVSKYALTNNLYGTLNLNQTSNLLGYSSYGLGAVSASYFKQFVNVAGTTVLESNNGHLLLNNASTANGIYLRSGVSGLNINDSNNYKTVLNVGGGSVGIGTSTPASILTSATTASGAFRGLTLKTPNSNNNNSQINFSVENGLGGEYDISRITTDYYAAGVVDLAFRTFGVGGLTEKMRIGANGPVGIGVTSFANSALSLETNSGIRVDRTGAPTQYIEVSGGDAIGPSIYATGAAKIFSIRCADNTNSSDSSAIRLTTGPASALVDRMVVSKTGVSVGNSYNASISMLDVNGNVSIGSGYAGIYPAPTDGMIVKGNVGIGTTTSTNQLTVQDTSQSTNAQLKLVNTGSTSYTYIGNWFDNSYMYAGGYYKVGPGYVYDDNTKCVGAIVVGAYPTSAGGSNFSVYTTNAVTSSALNRFYIAGNGFVGINTTSPNSRLEVSGGDIAATNASGKISLVMSGSEGRLYCNVALTTLNYWNGSAVTPAISYNNTGNVAIKTTPTTAYALQVSGAFAATTKSFVIEHPTKEGMKLRYASLEGPENGVYVRGKTTDSIIELPDYWTGLVDEESITVNLTPIGQYQTLYVKYIENNCVYIGSDTGHINCFYTIYAERKDVDKLKVEF